MTSVKRMMRRSKSENGQIDMLWSDHEGYGAQAVLRKALKRIKMKATHL
jgi:hypothetical protein